MTIISAKPRILHLDDDKYALELFKLIFGRYLDLIQFSDTQSFFEALTNDNFDVVILDYDLGETNGIEVLHSVKRMNPDIPVIFYTGQGTEEIARQAFLSGVADYFVKDFTGFAAKEKLLNSITKALEKKSAIQAWRESEEKFHRVFKESVHPILAIDSDGNYIECNKAAEEFLECSRDVILSSSIKTFMLPDNRETIISNHSKLHTSGGCIETHYCVNGKIKTLELCITPLTIDGKHVIFGVGKDISQQILIRETLEESEELYRTILESISDSVFITDDEGNFKFICSNVDYIFGYTKNEIYSMTNIRRLFGGDIYRLDELGKNGELQNIEIEIINKAGHQRNLLVNVKKVDINVGTLLFTCHDITDLKKTQEKLLQQEEKYKELLVKVEMAQNENGKPFIP